MYSGLSSSEEIKITNGSSFTVEYQTRYIPIAFPKGSNDMVWKISSKGYSYYMDELGNYMTLDSSGNVISISPTLTLNPSETNKILVSKKDNGTYGYTHDNRDVVLNLITKSNETYIPKGTKIIIIDMTLQTTPSYYYYICKEDTKEINLDDFYIMGSTKKVEEIIPEYKKQYLSQEASRITERLIIVFDLEQVEPNTYKNLMESVYSGTVRLEHEYGNIENGYIDIMDYVKSETNNDITLYTRSTPKVAGYEVNISKSGIKDFEVEFEKESYEEKETLTLEISVTKDDGFTNTKLSEGKIGIKIEVLGGKTLPTGIVIKYGGSYLPKYQNKYIIIPIKNYGTYTIEIESEIGTLETEEGAIKFTSTLCYLLDEQYYNDEVMLSKIEDNNIEAQIKDRKEPSLKVEIESNYIPLSTTKVKIKVYTKDVKENATQLKVYYKSKEGKVLIQGIRVNKDIVGSERGETYDLQIPSTLEKGSYELVFTNGDKVEIINILID